MMSTDATLVFHTGCSLRTYTCFNLISKSVGQRGHQHPLSERGTCTYIWEE